MINDIDLPALGRFLGQPIISVEIALPVSLGKKWSWGPMVRSNFAAIRTDSGTLLFHHGLVTHALLAGIDNDSPWYEGYLPCGTLTLIEPGNVKAEQEALALPRAFESPEPKEMVDLASLFPDAGRIYVPGATICDVSFLQTVRKNEFRFSVSGIRVFSSEATTIIEHEQGGVLACRIERVSS